MVKKLGLFVDNIRFYILIFSVFLSIGIVCYLRLDILSDTLFLIRVQQAFGFATLIFWYFALLATPLSSLTGKAGFMNHYLYSRRALGVSAAYFAVLHMLFGVFGQLGGLSGILLLPSTFQQAVLLGGFGLVVLVIMAATSFDRVIQWMTFPRWKWLHRLGYIAVVFVLLHIWIIGTHLESSVYRWAILTPLIILLGLEAWRISKKIEQSSEAENISMRLIIFSSLTFIAVISILYVPSVVSRYHDAHDSHDQQESI